MNRVWECPSCGGESTKCYRCSECGSNLADNTETEGRMGR